MSKLTFTSEEREKVKQAIQRLEIESCGEIVPYIAKASDDYDEARWFSATFLLGSGLLIEVLLSYLWLLPGWITPMTSSLIMLVLGLIGFLIPSIFPRTRLLFIGDDRIMERVGERALEVFVEEEMFNTRDRTGILIFVSRLEHKVLVLGDSGINAKVQPDDWQHVVDEIVQGIKHGQHIEGLVTAIDLCKDLLLEHGFTARPDNTNELTDDLRVEE